MAINTNDFQLLPWFPDLGMVAQSFKKERIIKQTSFPNPVEGITSPIEQSNIVGHRYVIETTMTKAQMYELQSQYTRYGINRPMLWKSGGKESEVNTYHYVTTLVDSQVAFALGDILIEEESLAIQLRRWNGTSLVSTDIGTDVYSLTDEYAGIVELTVTGSNHVYATYGRYLHVCFDNNEMKWEPVAKGYYHTNFSVREVTS